MAVLHPTRSDESRQKEEWYGATGSQRRKKTEEFPWRTLGVAFAVSLFVLSSMMVTVERKGLKPPPPSKPSKASRQAETEIREALRERGDELRAFMDLVMFEKRYLSLWSESCAELGYEGFSDYMNDPSTTVCGDSLEFCDDLCPPGTRCYDLCGSACEQGWGAQCLLTSFNSLESLCEQKAMPKPMPPQFIIQRKVQTQAEWLERRECGFATYCRACNSMDSWGCQRATNAVSKAIPHDNPPDEMPTLLAPPTILSVSTPDDILEVNASPPKNLSLGPFWRQPETFAHLATILNNDDLLFQLCKDTPAFFPGLPHPPGIFDQRLSVFT